jgi:hypothetical protein
MTFERQQRWISGAQRGNFSIDHRVYLGGRLFDPPDVPRSDISVVRYRRRPQRLFKIAFKKLIGDNQDPEGSPKIAVTAGDGVFDG